MPCFRSEHLRNASLLRFFLRPSDDVCVARILILVGIELEV
jgi:hypothetical protein